MGGCAVTELGPPRSLDTETYLRLNCRPIIVTLNGQQQRFVAAYNVDEGWIERYITDEHGKLSIYQDECRSEIVRGIVMVFWG